MIVVDVRGVGVGGMRNDRPGRRKMSTTRITSASETPQIPASSATEVGRRMPRGSE